MSNRNENYTTECSNCNSPEHNTKQCSLPITSVGMILFRFIGDEIEYVVICRKESYTMSDFIRDQYKFRDIETIKTLVDGMTISEKNLLLTKDISEIEEIYRPESYFKTRGKNTSKQNYRRIKAGVTINDAVYTLDNIVRNSSTRFTEPEWGFPKGRKNKHETDVECAMRELQEETNIVPEQYVILSQIPPAVENLLGENNKVYKYFYHIALVTENIELVINEDNLDQFYEVSKIEWLTANKIIEKFRPCYQHRKKIIKMLDEHLKMLFFGQRWA